MRRAVAAARAARDRLRVDGAGATSGPIRRSRRRGRPATPICVQTEAGAAGGHLPRHIPRPAAAGADRAGAGQQPRPDGRRRQHRRGARAISHPARRTSFRQLDANAGVTASGDKDNGVSAQLPAGRGVPELRARPVRPAALADRGPAQRYLATEAGGARDPAGAGRRHRRRLARPMPRTRACC